MEILSYMSAIMDLNQWMVLAMFVVFILMLFRGIPVAYALVGVSLLFILIGELVLDENRKLINQHHGQRQPAAQGAKQHLHVAHHTLRHTRLIEHQAHIDEHGQRNQNRIFDDPAEETATIYSQLLVVNSGALEFDILIDEFAIFIQDQFADQDEQ